MTVFKKKYLSQKLLCTLFSLDEKSCQLRTEFSLDSIIHSYKSLWTPKVVLNFQPVIPPDSQCVDVEKVLENRNNLSLTPQLLSPIPSLDLSTQIPWI